MAPNLSTAISHAILATAGIYSFRIHRLLPFISKAHGIIIVNSLVGVLKWGKKAPVCINFISL